jgi:hypothetical protein
MAIYPIIWHIKQLACCQRESEKACLRPGLNRGPSVYKTDALPLSHKGAEIQLGLRQTYIHTQHTTIHNNNTHHTQTHIHTSTHAASPPEKDNMDLYHHARDVDRMRSVSSMQRTLIAFPIVAIADRPQLFARLLQRTPSTTDKQVIESVQSWSARVSHVKFPTMQQQ